MGSPRIRKARRTRRTRAAGWYVVMTVGRRELRLYAPTKGSAQECAAMIRGGQA